MNLHTCGLNCIGFDENQRLADACGNQLCGLESPRSITPNETHHRDVAPRTKRRWQDRSEAC